MRKIREEIDRNEERFWQPSDKVDKYRMVDAEMAAQLQGLQAGEERRGSNASQEVDCCMEMRVELFFVVGADQARSEFDAMCQVFLKKFEAETPSAQMPGKGRGRRNSEDEQEQGKASQVGAMKEGTPASSLELDLLLVRGAHGECGGAGKSGADNEPKRPLSNSPSRPSMEEDALL